MLNISKLLSQINDKNRWGLMVSIEVYIHEDSCDHCKPTLKFLTAVVSAVNRDDVTLIVHQISKNREAAEKAGIPRKQLPVIVLESGCQIIGTLSHDLIGVLICSLLTKSKIPIQSFDKFELNKKEAPILMELVSAMIEYQAAYTLRRDKSYTFIIKESTSKVPIKRYKRLAEHTKLMLLTNFDTKPSPKLYEFGLHSNVFLGHIIRENIVMAANLIIWKDRANHISFFRLKRAENGNYTGTCSSLLGDGKQTIRDFFKPLFLTSATIKSDGDKSEGQNRIVANIKDISNDLDQLVRR